MVNKKPVVLGEGGVKIPFLDRFKVQIVSKSLSKKFAKFMNPGKTRVLEVGCGYDARLLRSLSKKIHSGVGIDFSVNDQIKGDSNFEYMEGDLFECMPQLKSESFDLILFLSILEHLDNPLAALKEARRLLLPGGYIFFNSPNWFGKWVLENVMTTKLLDPKRIISNQVDTHKMYFSPRDMWPILIEAGFISSDIKLWRSNFHCSLSGIIHKSTK